MLTQILASNLTVFERIDRLFNGEHGNAESRDDASSEKIGQHMAAITASDRPIMPDPRWHDRRLEPRPDHLARGRSQGSRSWEDMRGIMLHQTASGHLDADHRLLLACPAHAIVHRDGSATLLHYAMAYVYHGHGLNRTTFGLEIDCRDDGLEGEPRTFWRSKRERNGYKDKRGKWHPPKSREELRLPATDEQLKTALKICLWVNDLRRHHIGEGITTIYAHRQSAAKLADPGERIWKAVALPFCYLTGASQRPKMTMGKGRRLPDVWTGLRNGIEY